MEAYLKNFPDPNLSNVLFQAVQGLNLVYHYLEEAEQTKDPGAVRWLEDTKACYQHILGSAREFARERDTAL